MVLRVLGSGVGVRVHQGAWHTRTQKVQDVGKGKGFRIQWVRCGGRGSEFRGLGVGLRVQE